ncbi:MAG TPA: TonB-dependent receptor [Ignavibacteriaceae bacterium]|nr:TonB-dependent receptor [Ignavibacteriaceae bacterium]
MINFYCKKIKFNYAFLLLTLFIFQSFLIAQTGTITGHVYDKNTNEALAKANVILKGTSLGAATDFDGNFNLRGVPEGTYTVVVSYIGYNSSSADIKVTSGQTVLQDFHLEPVTLEGETVEITAQAEGQLDAINQQLNSNTIENVVSKSRIKELPDVNAAESIGRLPGVSLERSGGEANKVEVRGLNPKYSLVTVNGVIIPAVGTSNQSVTGTNNMLGSGDRSVDLSLVSSNMLDGISLKKVTTPDMDADVLGGTIDLRLREAPPGLKIDASAQGGYNALQKYYGNYNFNLSLSNRFFDNRLGMIANGNTDNFDRSADKLQASYASTGTTSGATDLVDQELNLREEQINRKRSGASLLLDYLIPNGKLTANGFFNQLKWTGTYNINDMWTPAAGYNTNRHYYFLEETGGTTNLYTSMIGVQQDFSWIKYDVSISKTGSYNNTPEDRVWQFSQEANSFPTSAITPNTPLEDIPVLANNDTNHTWLAQVIVNSDRIVENTSGGQFNVQIPFTLNEQISGLFKGGGKFRRVSRSNNQNQFAAKNLQYGNNPNPSGAIVAINKFFPEWNIDSLTKFWGGLPITPFLTNYSRSNFLDGDYPMGFIQNKDMMNKITDSLKTSTQYWRNYSIPSLGFDYSGIEDYQAGYIMGEFNITKYFIVIPGIRWEGEHTIYNGQRYRQIQINGANEAPPADYTPITSTRTNSFWLPMVNIIAKPTDWLQIKLARTENLSHPDYLQYAPISNISGDQNTINASNSQLKTSRSENYDVEASVYQNHVGYFSVNGFYKKIKDLIFSANYVIQRGVTLPSGLNIPDSWLSGTAPTIYTYLNNPNPAKYFGIELDWQTHFWYLPSVLQGLVLNVNYTHIYSEMFLQYDSTKVDSVVGRPPRLTTYYSAVPRQIKTRIPDQPANILNITLGYDIYGFSARLSYLYQENKSTGIGYSGVYPSTLVSTYTGAYARWDLSLQQKINTNLLIYIHLNNLNARPDRSFTGSGLVNPQYFEYYGFTMDVGVRYNL